MGEQNRWQAAGRIAASLAAGRVALVLVLPASGVDTAPPKCFSMFDYSVPCAAGVAPGVAVVIAAATWVGISLWNRRR